jgi:hypothetical protein
MKSLIRKVLSRAVRNDVVWSFLDGTLIRMAASAKRQRTKLEVARRNSQLKDVLISISPDLTVKHGPFKGMIYPELKSIGSSLLPKLLGSYESELHSVLEKICATEYCAIVDIGCAEGYYAVGLGMRVQSAKIFAYDTDSEAIHLCRQMAQINDVGDRLVTGAFCDARTLREIPFTGRALIVSDCEGYERHLFTAAMVPSLARHDLLIEVHDFIEIGTSSQLEQRFQDTHVITRIQSIDDIAKAHSYKYDELDRYDLATRKQLLAEQRPAIMEWFYMTPRAS